MAEHDNSYKLLFSHVELVADLLRGFVHEPWAARLDLAPPAYVVEAEGPDHHRVFTATVAVGDVARSGTGSSKKQAEMAAALAVWHALSDRA